jgi:hypothetical protein
MSRCYGAGIGYYIEDKLVPLKRTGNDLVKKVITEASVSGDAIKKVAESEAKKILSNARKDIDVIKTTADMKASRLENGSGFLHSEKHALSDLLNAKRGRGRPRGTKKKTSHSVTGSKGSRKHSEDEHSDDSGEGLYF